MTSKEYIESGRLELFVYGTLPDTEQAQVAADIAKNPELQAEVESIEASLLNLSKATSTGLNPSVKQGVLQKINQKTAQQKPKVKIITSNFSYFGWAAAILLLGGILWLLKLNQDLQEELQVVSSENELQETQLVNSSEKVQNLEALLVQMSQPGTRKLTLPGNEINAPDSAVAVFYDDENDELILDISRLPDAPEGMVYQAWSLTFEPLTPNSIGLLAKGKSASNKIFRLRDIPEAEGFGITLEPSGGSKSPNMEQLYALGII
ncbi:anti-sigma factor [Psychroflexus sediminis]|uniref:Anti-sigma-K factor rskA n=1 Tax=Psychroflexus sediminis TaxID=470826 RepID=A0A1G7Y1U1_9FLAO|nr:anti-sigma factor [Psychroflexus sediminis]SDG90333.1 Anti-sigma-K factor rskA [Psychroflexus sediminis]